MRVDVSKFGASLLSRPAGREAALALQANVLRGVGTEELIEIDFSKVLVLTPSWADEFVSVLREQYGVRVKLLPEGNASVRLTLEAIQESVT